MEAKLRASLCVLVVSLLLVWSSHRVVAQTVSFDVPSEGYSVEETAGSIEVCVIVTGTVSTTFTLTLSTFPSTAHAFVDYTPVTESFTFTRTSGTTDCATISIVQDSILESGEFFFVTLSSSDTNITLPGPPAVTILDSNNVVLDFQTPTFFTNEGTAVQVCAVIQVGDIARPVSFTVTPSDGTATGLNDDYVPISISRTFTSNSDSPLCFPVSVNEDTQVENDEMFTITLSSADSPSDRLGTVTIIDNDGVTVALSSSTLSVAEGNSGTTTLPLCVQLQNTMSGLERDVLLLLNTTVGTADESDFVPLSSAHFTLPLTTPLNQDVCFDLSIKGDEIREEDETFTVTVSVGNSNDIISGSNAVTVTIQDDNDVIADCMPLSNPLNGNVQFNSTLQDAMAAYTCNTGYTLVGSVSRTCLSSALWSDNDPTCQLVDCGALGSPGNGAVSDPETTYESVASYTCNVGYDIIGVGSRTCQEDGEWSGVEPFCQIVDCGELAPPENGLITYSLSTVYQSQALYSCNSGYELSNTGSFRRFCRANGQWSSVPPGCIPVDCGSLNNPVDGMVSYTDTTFMSNATYSCNVGHTLTSGDQVRQCQADMLWSGTQPTCIVDCEGLMVPSNGMISYSAGTLLGSMATYTCDLGYDLIGGDAVRTCDPSGSWSGAEPTGCQPKDCGDPGLPDNGQVMLSSGTTLGSVATFSCNIGYDIIGETMRECGTDGVWTNSVPTCMIVDCGGLLSPDDGTVTLSSTVFSSQANYSCNLGYNLVGVNTRTCLASGLWSDVAPTCQIVDCGMPNDPENGAVTFTLTVYRAFALYSCEDGYNLVPNEEMRMCETNGMWSGDDRVCQPVDCGPLSNPTNGQVATDQTTLGFMAVYSCNTGYDLVGEESIVCQASGLWSGGTPDCIPVDCGSLTSPVNGNISLSGTTFESVADYTCQAGYLLVGSESRLCQANRTWSGDSPICEAVDCSGLSDPDNGMVSLDGTRLGSMATYQCNTGYELVGDSERQCTEEGVWSGNQPDCDIVQCVEELSNPTNGNVMVTGDTYLSEAHYDCIEGYAVVGASVRVCQADGLWSASEPHCEENMCPDLGELDNGVITLTEVAFEAGLLATYVCDEGYTISSSTAATRVCQLSGEWTGEAPTCIINDCREDPPAPDNGSVLTSGTTFGSRALYFCETGYVLHPSDDYERVCIANETWSGFNPTCEPIDCGVLENPTNGEVITGGTTLGLSVTYTCNSGYELVGDATRTCESNGLWSNSEPTCLDIDECLGEHGCDQECVNDAGGFHCVCRAGYQLMDTFTCIDFNECEDNNGGCAQLCNNTFGSFLCECRDGYMLNSDSINCNDIDECILGIDSCHGNATCLNTNGSFECSCDEGYEGDGLICTDVDECSIGTHLCDVNALCNNTVGGFECDCLPGYEGDGFMCQNIDECQSFPPKCDENADCTDNNGSFTCDCKLGFSGDGFSCERQCSTMFQLYLSGINNCEEWSLDSTEEKLSDIQQSVMEGVQQTCPTCDAQISHIQEGEFSCPSGEDSPNILYRAILFGNEPNVCNELVATVTNWIQSPQASLQVQSGSLQVSQNCLVEIDSFESELDCFIPTTEVGGLANGARTGNLTVIGAAAGVSVGLLLIALVVIIVAIVVIVKRKKQKRFTLHSHFIDPDQSYDSLSHTNTPLRESRRSRANQNDYEENNNTLETSTFNPDGNVLPTLGRTFSDLKRHYVQSPYAEIGEATLGNGKSHQDEFYEKVYDDGYHFDIEEVYDHVQSLPASDIADTSLERSVADNPLYEKLDID